MEPAARALSVADRLAIQELLALYNVSEDSGDVETWVNTFAPNAVHTGANGKSLTGHAELRSFLRERAEKAEAKRSVHWMSNVMITSTEHGAQAQHYSMMVEKTKDGFRVRNMSLKTDDMRKENGDWRIHSRVAKSLPAESPAR